MDTVDTYRQIIQSILLTYAEIPYAYGDIQCKPFFDQDHDSYGLITLGWDGVKRIHGCLIHIELIGDKVWIQRDDTDNGVAYDLVTAGIPKYHIVLGFHTPDVRPFTEYAVA